VRVTANQVTFARLCAIPVLAALLYGGTGARFTALVLGIGVGLTDMLDGYLARKYGPTVLGGLMDPVADKVFVAVVLLVQGDLGWVPWWLVHVVLVREFLITALRSSFEVRHRSLRTTYLAKVKTWVQMFALAVSAAVVLLPARTLTLFVLGTSAAAVLTVAVTLLLGRRWRGIWIFAGFFVAGAALHLVAGAHVLLLAVLIVVAAITWASGLDYIVVAVRELAGAQDFHMFDLWRMVGALTVPILATLCLSVLHVPVWIVVALVIAEIFHGGLDNLLAHHAGWTAASGGTAWPWAARTLGASAFLGAALVIARPWPGAAEVLAAAALAVSAATTGLAFWRNRRFYLQEKLREKRHAYPTT
jgi:CDP-diacylglycerol--glycerol-3-phosphate 3-phosphatidyltransferase